MNADRMGLTARDRFEVACRHVELDHPGSEEVVDMLARYSVRGRTALGGARNVSSGTA